MSKEAIKFLCEINPSFKNMDINNTNTFGGDFLLYCIDKALNQGQSLPIDSVSDSVDTGIDFSYRDENGEIQHNNVSTETAQALLSRWQEQEIKVNRFIANYHKTN